MKEALSQNEIHQFLKQIPNWEIITQEGIQSIQRIYGFDNFVQALAFTNQVGALVEMENHHPLLQTECA